MSSAPGIAGRFAQPGAHSEAVGGAGQRTPEQLERDLQCFNDHKRQVWSDMQAGSDEFDRGLLTLSSGALALSLAFIKDVVPFAKSVHIPLLFISWISFALCIIVTLASFRFSVIAQERHLEYARRVYIDGDLRALGERHWCARALDWCTVLGGLALFVGFALTIWFAITNITAERSRIMTENGKSGTTQVLKVQDGRAPVRIVSSQPREDRGRQPIAPIVTTPNQSGAQQSGSSGVGGGTAGQQNSGGKK